MCYQKLKVGWSCHYRCWWLMATLYVSVMIIFTVLMCVLSSDYKQRNITDPWACAFGNYSLCTVLPLLTVLINASVGYLSSVLSTFINYPVSSCCLSVHLIQEYWSSLKKRPELQETLYLIFLSKNCVSLIIESHVGSLVM